MLRRSVPAALPPKLSFAPPLTATPQGKLPTLIDLITSSSATSITEMSLLTPLVL